MLKMKMISFIEVWKMLSISSFGTFFFLPVLIWDIGVHQEIHKFIILVYIILSQLTAYMGKLYLLYSVTFISLLKCSIWINQMELSYFVKTHNIYAREIFKL